MAQLLLQHLHLLLSPTLFLLVSFSSLKHNTKKILCTRRLFPLMENTLMKNVLELLDRQSSKVLAETSVS